MTAEAEVWDGGTPPVALLKKLHKAMQMTGGYIQKDGYNSGQNYGFVSERAFITKCRDVMLGLGIVITGSMVEGKAGEGLTKSGKTNLFTGAMRYRFWDVDTGQYIDCIYPGQGADSSDKGVYKALTGAFKYALRQTLMIATGDDPEATDEPDGYDAVKWGLIERMKAAHASVTAAGVAIAAMPQDEDLLGRSVDALERALEAIKGKLQEPGKANGKTNGVHANN